MMALVPMLSPSALALVGFFAFILLHCLGNYLPCRVKAVPGPWHTLFTHYGLKYHALCRTRMYYVHALHQKYGPIVRISPREVSIADPPTVQAVYKAQAGYPKSAWYANFATPSPNDEGTESYTPLFSTGSNKEHGTKRKLFARAFSNSSLMANWDDDIRAKVRLAVSKIRAEASAPGGTGADLLKWWSLMTTDVIAQLIYGESFRSIELGKQTRLIDALQKAGLVAIVSLEFPLLGWMGRHLVPFGALRDLFHTDQVLEEYTSLAWRNLRSGGAGLKNIFAQALALADNAKELGQNERFIKQTVRGEANNFMFAGSDTTAATLTYLVYAVLDQPALQAALEEEVQQLSPDLTQEEIINKAPLLNSVIDEALRVYSAVCGGLPRDVPAGGAMLCGYYIPEGMVVSAQAYTLHRDNAFANAEQFDGWRFMKQQLTPEQKAALMPFGLGARACLGMHLAMMEMRFATALFFRECRGAKLCPETTAESMKMMDVFLAQPKDHRCNITVPA